MPRVCDYIDAYALANGYMAVVARAGMDEAA